MDENISKHSGINHTEQWGKYWFLYECTVYWEHFLILHVITHRLRQPPLFAETLLSDEDLVWRQHWKCVKLERWEVFLKHFYKKKKKKKKITKLSHLNKIKVIYVEIDCLKKGGNHKTTKKKMRSSPKFKNLLQSCYKMTCWHCATRTLPSLVTVVRCS